MGKQLIVYNALISTHKQITSPDETLNVAGRKPTVTDGELLRIFAESPHEFLATNEVADEIEMSQQGTSKRLDSLSEDGYLYTRVAGNVRIWWLTQEGKEQALAEMD